MNTAGTFKKNMNMTWYEHLSGGFDILPPEIIEANMLKTYENKHYKDLRENNYTRILGIWDDNDYGVNDGEWDNPVKHE